MIRLRKYMHFFVAVIIYSLLMVSVYGSTPTVTRTKGSSVRGKYNVYKNTYTSTTGKDTVIVLDADGNAFEVGDLMSQADKVILLQFQSAEGTASSVDKDVLWQGTLVSDADATILTGNDWITLETDQQDNANTWLVTIDLDSNPIVKLRAVVLDTATLGATAVAEELYIKIPRAQLDFQRRTN